MKISVLLILSLIVALNLPLQINLVDTHETHATEMTTPDIRSSILDADCHVSGACSPMQIAFVPSIIYAGQTLQLISWPAAVVPTTYLTALETPPPRV